MTIALTLLSAAFVLIGALFALVASIGLLRLPDLYSRMHAASKAGTVGSGLLLIALAIHAGEAGVMARALAGVIFFLLTAPISAHLLAKAAYAVGYRLGPTAVRDEMASTVEEQTSGSI
ncbi:monovalent cation/H(+) antiporter subunit G [Pseudohoeflea coraliihabitans]|uniref:Monovalent cation/H(+) antiporter subunit G n=1 Tax=Pseudohoeflea coraliihabitans TaxID=2860393 RepID=A0ABS6WRR8_9HYPH|nr:monovalent cation/H(+) antiporter subunit G [Pseudohoeflea sp. DP4N28-3]MBW3098638.1 monovalent cation/H(+) antiporter subunit G [Pseudohoeflea sp. DP4N28-3]